MSDQIVAPQFGIRRAMPQSPRYERERKSRPQPKAQTQAVDPNKQFDERMLLRISKAKGEDGWIDIRTTLINAYRHKNLRASVWQAFVDRCPLHLIGVFYTHAGGAPPSQ